MYAIPLIHATMTGASLLFLGSKVSSVAIDSCRVVSDGLSIGLNSAMSVCGTGITQFITCVTDALRLFEFYG